MRWGVLLGGSVLLAAVVPGARAQEELPDPSDGAVALLRQVCDLQWVEGVCEATGYPEPQYATGTDPSPDEPLALRIGAVHEHSGYSDGDPDTRPADYFAAGRTGHNTADAGGDTGVRIDFMLSSEHSENERLAITTAEACIDPSGIPDAIAQLEVEGAIPPLRCSNIEHADHHRKWNETLAQAIEATEHSAEGGYTGFTAMRGFEWTNDYYNHLGVYFSRNVVNAKVDGSYVDLDVMWDWLRTPPERGGGADALVVFNHPGGWPALTPFDGDLPHNQLLNDAVGGANWHDVAHVPDLDERVAGIEVNGGDDLTWYVKALRNGWHLGPLAAEDEHQREWSSSGDGKTLIATRGRSPRDYYFALSQHRTVALHADVIGGAPGERATHPEVWFWAGPEDVQDPSATLLGSAIREPGDHVLRLAASGLVPGSPVVLVGADRVVPLGQAGPWGDVAATHTVTAPTEGEAWWFALVCPPGTGDCGTADAHHAVTAPIWLGPGAAPESAPAPSTEDLVDMVVGALGSLLR